MVVQKSSPEANALRADYLLRGKVAYMKRACCNSQTNASHESSCREEKHDWLNDPEDGVGESDPKAGSDNQGRPGQ